MKALFTVLLIVFALPASAQSINLPALYDVSDVANDDALNIRSEPNGASLIIGEFAFDAIDIEIVALNDAQSWGRVNVSEGSGWVSLNFMTRQPNQGAGVFPNLATCSGTEPFWTLGFRGDLIVFEEMAGSATPMTFDLKIASYYRFDRFAFSGSNGLEQITITGIVSQRMCSDGMSDRVYGFAVDLITEQSSAGDLLSGCCSLQSE